MVLRRQLAKAEENKLRLTAEITGIVSCEVCERWNFPNSLEIIIWHSCHQKLLQMFWHMFEGTNNFLHFMFTVQCIQANVAEIMA